MNHNAPDLIDAEDVLGVDLGRTDIAYTSDGESWHGQQLEKVRNKYAWLRLALQKKASLGTRSLSRRCRELLKRLSGKEKRFQRHVNHEISRQLVNNAATSKRAISLEDLTGIRQRTNQQPRNKQERRKSNSWSFYQLRQFLEYKCILAGVRLILVNPAYTSKTCHQCFHLGNRNGKRYSCANLSCGWKGDADYNGAQNIAALGRFINTPGGSGLACELSSFSESLGLLKTPTSA